jgi:tetratricopeptide (TPR) repeat protein
MQLAEALIQTGELNDALDALNQQLEMASDDDSARRLRIGVLLRLAGDSDFRVALADFDNLAKISAEDEVQRSIILEKLRDLEGALQAMIQALALKPDDARLVERSLHLLIAQDKIGAALELVRTQPRIWRWLQWEGDLLVMSGDDIVATARYGLALAQINERYTGEDHFITPIRARLLLARGDAYRRLGDLNQAEKHYIAAGKLIPTDPTIPFNRGLIAMQRGSLPNALKFCREGLEQASTLLRAEMEKALHSDEQYAELTRELLS